MSRNQSRGTGEARRGLALPPGGAAPVAQPAAAVMRPRTARQLGPFACGVIGLFGLMMPVMRYIEFGGSRVNAALADVLLLPVLFLLRRHLLRSGGLGAWLLAMWVVNLISWSFSVSLLTMDVFVRESVKIATCFLYALAGFAIGREARGEKALVKGLVFFGVPMAAVAIFAFFTRVPSFFISDSRVVGTLTDPNAFGIYLAMLLPLATSLGTGWAAVAVPAFLGATIVSFSRTGLAATGASLVLSMLNLGVRRYLLVLLACVIVGAAVWGAASTTPVGHRVADYRESLSQRQGLWRLAGEVVSEHPLLGVGSGNWEAAAGRRTEPHNTFLSVMVDNGLVGFAVFVIPVGVWVVRGLRRTHARRWAIAVLVGLVGGIAVSLDDFRPFWLSAGLLAALASVRARAQYAAASMGARQGAPRERHWDRRGRTDWMNGHATH